MRNYYPPPDLRLETLIASFGEARLLNNLDGQLRLEGGSVRDRAEALAWITAYFPTTPVAGLEEHRPANSNSSERA